jgi:hypothetical protein
LRSEQPPAISLSATGKTNFDLPIDNRFSKCYKLPHELVLYSQACKADLCHPFEGVWHRFALGVQHQPFVKTKPPFKRGAFYFSRILGEEK